MKRQLVSKRGDTVVEVMIAIIVLGAGLAGAFAISTRSVQTTQLNHEQYQAQLYANQQAELLRQDYANYLAGGGTRSAYNPTIPCYGGGCSFEGLYDVAIVDSSADGGKISGFSVGAKTYTITVTWPSLGGGPDRVVELVYGI